MTVAFQPRQRIETETVWYLGYEIEVCNRDFLIYAPNRDVACFPSMSRARQWVRAHRKGKL